MPLRCCKSIFNFYRCFPFIFQSFLHDRFHQAYSPVIPHRNNPKPHQPIRESVSIFRRDDNRIGQRAELVSPTATVVVYASHAVSRGRVVVDYTNVAVAINRDLLMTFEFPLRLAEIESNASPEQYLLRERGLALAAILAYVFSNLRFSHFHKESSRALSVRVFHHCG